MLIGNLLEQQLDMVNAARISGMKEVPEFDRLRTLPIVALALASLAALASNYVGARFLAFRQS